MNRGVVQQTAMSAFSLEDYELAFADEADMVATQADRVLDWLRMMDGPSRYQVTRLGHSLQSATRAEKDGADTETIVCALLHDIGDIVGTVNHSQVAAAILRPYVSEQNAWIVEHHGLFQGYYWFHLYGKDRNARDRYRNHPFYEPTVRFCTEWDQNCFDPDYPTRPLEHFEPMVREIFARTPRDIFD